MARVAVREAGTGLTGAAEGAVRVVRAPALVHAAVVVLVAGTHAASAPSVVCGSAHDDGSCAGCRVSAVE